MIPIALFPWIPLELELRNDIGEAFKDENAIQLSFRKG